MPWCCAGQHSGSTALLSIRRNAEVEEVLMADAAQGGRGDNRLLAATVNQTSLHDLLQDIRLRAANHQRIIDMEEVRLIVPQAVGAPVAERRSPRRHKTQRGVGVINKLLDALIAVRVRRIQQSRAQSVKLENRVKLLLEAIKGVATVAEAGDNSRQAIRVQAELAPDCDVLGKCKREVGEWVARILGLIEEAVVVEQARADILRERGGFIDVDLLACPIHNANRAARDLASYDVIRIHRLEARDAPAVQEAAKAAAQGGCVGHRL